MNARNTLKIHLHPIPDNSYKLYIYLDAKKVGNDLDALCILTPKHGGIECNTTIGTLPYNVLTEIAQIVYDMGYDTLFYMSVKKGYPFISTARFSYASEGHDYYAVDLLEYFS